MKILINYSPSLGKETSISVDFQTIGEYKSLPVDDAEKWAKVKIIKVLEDPTPARTGSAVYRVEYSNGSHHEDIGVIGKPRGGARPGSGRPKGDKPVAITVNISEDAKKILDTAQNKNQMVNDAILAFNQK